MTAWLLLASFHQEPVPSQVTAAGSCVHVTLTGNHAAGNTHWRKRGFKKRRTKSSGSCNRQGELPASHSHFDSSAQDLRLSESYCRNHKNWCSRFPGNTVVRCGELELPTALYLTAHEEFSFCPLRYVTVESPPH